MALLCQLILVINWHNSIGNNIFLILYCVSKWLHPVTRFAVCPFYTRGFSCAFRVLHMFHCYLQINNKTWCAFISLFALVLLSNSLIILLGISRIIFELQLNILSSSLLYIETADRPGLLLEIIKIITDINIDVESAEIDTEVSFSSCTQGK